MSEKRRGLGRGLGALIPSSGSGERPVDVFFGSGQRLEESATESELSPASAQSEESDQTPDADLVEVPGARYAEIPVGDIHPNPRQPRRVFSDEDLSELADSIKIVGVLQPIVVRPTQDPAHPYELIMGERRWRASQVAGLVAIPAIVKDTDDSDMLRDALLENLHRAALNPLEEAAAYQQLLDDFGCTQEELATRIARSRPQISNTLRLLKLPAPVQRRVAAGVLSAGHARALLRLQTPDSMEGLANRIVSEGLSVRATEEIAALDSGAAAGPARRGVIRSGNRIDEIERVSEELSDLFDTRVTIGLGQKKGKITVEFASVEDLNRILKVMAPKVGGVLEGR